MSDHLTTLSKISMAICDNIIRCKTDRILAESISWEKIGFTLRSSQARPSAFIKHDCLLSGCRAVFKDKYTTLSIYFEAGNLFVLARIEGLTSITEAREILCAKPALAFDGRRATVVCSGQTTHIVDTTAGDECGRWPADSDRLSPEGYRSAQITFSELLDSVTSNHVFLATWFSAVECEKDAEGHFENINCSVSGDIGTPALR